MPRRFSVIAVARRRGWAAAVVTLLVGLPALVAAQPPSPLLPELVAFPGAFAVPYSSQSAGLALADRWLGNHPGGNPAGAPGQAVELSPMLLHVSRQDLRANNRDFDETPAFLDVAGGWIGGRWGGMQISGYLVQPVTRSEDNAYTRGRIFDPVPPATVASDYSMREFRGGVAVSLPLGDGRIGVAGEFINRDDSFNFKEASGSPEAGTRLVKYSGSGLGGQAGVQYDFGEIGEAAIPRVTVGAALHFTSELTMDGTLEWDLLGADSSGVFSVTREAGFEGGLSMRVMVNDAWGLLAGFGGRTEQSWAEFDVVSGKGASWSLATEYRDPREAWTIRIGFGSEHMEGVPEDRASSFGLGFSYAIEGGTIDVGAVRRSLSRSDAPTAFEDRVILSVRIGL